MLRPRVAAGSAMLALSLLVSLSGSTVAASSYQAIVLRDACIYSGGAHGTGYLLYKVKVREVGLSGTNYFTIKSMLQKNSGVRWRTVSTWPKETSSHFADDSVSHYRIVTRRYDHFELGSIGTRVQMIVQFWSDDYGLLTTMKVNSIPC